MLQEQFEQMRRQTLEEFNRMFAAQQEASRIREEEMNRREEEMNRKMMMEIERLRKMKEESDAKIMR